MAPTNPQWVTDGAQSLSNTIMNLGTKDPKSYVADADPLQTLAATNAGKLTTSPLYGQAADIFKQAGQAPASTYQAQGYQAQGYNPTMGEASSMSAASLLDGLQNYMSPYTQNVVDTTLAGFDVDAGRQRAQAALNEAQTGAFGGSGAALSRSMLGEALSRNRAQTEAQLRDQAFTQGSGLSVQDAGFRQQAAATNAANANAMAMANMQAKNQAAAFGADAGNQAGQFNAGAFNQAGQYNAGAQDTALSRLLASGQGLVGLGASQGADDRATVALQGDLGAQLRQIAQAKAGADISLAGAQSGMFGGLPLNLFNGQNITGNSTSTSTTSDPMGAITSLAGLALAPFTGGASALGSLGSMFGGGASVLNKAGQAAKNIGG